MHPQTTEVICCIMKRTYTDLERAEAQGLAAAIGPAKAAEKLGIPRRTVASWMHTPAASPIIAAAEQDVADALRAAHAKALAAVMEGLSDPKARLGDRARALEVLGEQLALAEGRATANINQNVHTSGFTNDLNDDERRALRGALNNELSRRRRLEEGLTDDEKSDLADLLDGDADPDLRELLNRIDLEIADVG